MFSPYINHFIQPDTIIPNPSNPQSLNRFSYVGNNPVRFNDPTGHYACGDGEASDCDPNPNGLPPVISKTDDKGGKDGSGGSGDICSARPPYIPEYTCGTVVTDKTTLQNIPPVNVVIGGDTFTGYGPEDPPVVNGQTLSPSYSGPANRALSIVDLFMMAVTSLYYNESSYSFLTNSYVQGAIPYVQHNKSGNTAIAGAVVYNHTGYSLIINHVTVNKQNQGFTADIIQSGNVGSVQIPAMLVGDTISVEIVVSAFQPSTNTLYAVGTINYNGPLQP